MEKSHIRNAELEKKAMYVLNKALSMGNTPLVAFSGGKDSIVVTHMAARLGVQNYVCDISMTFKKQRENIKQIAELLGINVAYKEGVTMDWLKKNKHVLFSTDNAVRSWSFSQRQQRTVKRQAKAIGADMQVFGRRTEENSVKSAIYTTKAGLQCHPIRDWKEADVWTYLERHNIPKPYMYTTALGKKEGNTPWHSVHPKRWGNDIENCWDAVEAMGDIYKRGILDD